MSAQLVTVAEAARQLGISRYRLLRLMVEAERTSGRRIGCRSSSPRKRRWLVTVEAARSVLSEAGTKRSVLGELRRTVRAEIADMDARLDTIAEDAARRVMAPIRRELEERDEEVAQLVLDVARGLNRVTDAIGLEKTTLSMPQQKTR